MLTTITISVLSLFHPTSVDLKATNSNKTFTAGDQETVVDSAGPITVSIAGKIARAYPGPIRLRSRGGEVEILIVVDSETAVAWAVAAESAPKAGREALKAMAVVARSWYRAARGRHREFDFCDTTHCQFLGTAKALPETVGATRGLLLLFDGKPVEALHSGDCGGTTKSLIDVGLTPSGYPFYPVQCDAPGERWSRNLTDKEAATLLAAPHSENARLSICRRAGWDRIPSNEYALDGLQLKGRGRGHGVGLCQLGAAKMAANGADYLAILRHYFPNTTVGLWP